MWVVVTYIHNSKTLDAFRNKCELLPQLSVLNLRPMGFYGRLRGFNPGLNVS